MRRALAEVIRDLEGGIRKEARIFLHLFDGEVTIMGLTGKAERLGFAPSTYICPYHIWKPKGVLRSCTCSPTPSHQVEWEEGVEVRQATIQPDTTIDRGFFSGIDRRTVAIFYRASGEAIVTALRTARKEVAGRFLRVCEVVRSRQCGEAELQKSGGPECRT
jgi:hypothetical protein